MPAEMGLRFFHVAAGFVGLALGPIVMWAPKTGRLHPRIGDWYFFVVTASCVSAAALAALDLARLWFFLVAAVGTYVFALPGYLAAKRRRDGWLLIHVVGVTSSYSGLVIAFLVTNIRWILGTPNISFAVRLVAPMFVSTCIVAWVGWQVHRGRLPKQ